jgi:hypothetical protein
MRWWQNTRKSSLPKASWRYIPTRNILTTCHRHNFISSIHGKPEQSSNHLQFHEVSVCSVAREQDCAVSLSTKGDDELVHKWTKRDWFVLNVGIAIEVGKMQLSIWKKKMLVINCMMSG